MAADIAPAGHRWWFRNHCQIGFVALVVALSAGRAGAVKFGVRRARTRRVVLDTEVASDIHENAECTCLNWMHVYESGAASCGGGVELAGAAWRQASGLPPQSHLADRDLCPEDAHDRRATFFPSQNHTSCVKLDVHPTSSEEAVPRTWCYVSARCQRLDNRPTFPAQKGPAGTSLRWKLCQAGEDTVLGDMEPHQLFEHVRKRALAPSSGSENHIHGKKMPKHGRDVAATEANTNYHTAALMAYPRYARIDQLGPSETVKQLLFAEENMIVQGMFGDLFITWNGQLWYLPKDAPPECQTECPHDYLQANSWPR